MWTSISRVEASFVFAVLTTMNLALISGTSYVTGEPFEYADNMLVNVVAALTP